MVRLPVISVPEWSMGSTNFDNRTERSIGAGWTGILWMPAVIRPITHMYRFQITGSIL